uniref:Uncharacterized protein n=1 Tax=Ixodes ricinus TaxID=34613 RepID=A0A6B0UWX9_IXORI
MWASSTGRTLLTSFFSVGSCVSSFSSSGVFPFVFFAFFFFWESGCSDGFCGLYVFASSSSSGPGILLCASLSSSPVETPGVPSRLGVLVFSVPGASNVLVSLKTSSGVVILSGLPNMWGSSTGRTLLTSFFSVGSCVSASSSAGVFPFVFFGFFFFW